MAQKWRVPYSQRPRPALDAATLDALAIHYVGRYATTAGKLSYYLNRKLRERGWAGDSAPDIDAIVQKCVDAGYVNDRSFAEARARTLERRGLGERRVVQALQAAGIDAAIVADLAPSEAAADAAADRFARRKRIGPYDDAPPDPLRRRKQIEAMLRAGHRFDVARRVIDSTSQQSSD